MGKIVIIGAGIGGIAAANLLAKKGHEVHVYDRLPTPGGRANILRADGFTFDTGPSWYLMPEVFERYYAALGEAVAGHLDIVRLTPSYKVFYESGEPLLITGDIDADAATFEAQEPGAGQALRRYARQARRLYRLSLKYFLYTSFDRARDFLRPGILLRLPRVLRLMLTPLHRYVGGFVRDQRLQQILEYPMVFLGTSPYRAPALYSLMGALDFDSGVYYPRGGIYTVIESLVAIGTAAGVTYHMDSNVTAITVDEGRATGVTLADGTSVGADAVISNADIHATETRLLPTEARSYPDGYWEKLQPSCSALLVSLGVRGAVPELEHHNLFFVNAWRENFEALYETATVPEKASLYVSRTSATDPDVAPDGYETLFMLVPLPAATSLSPDEADAMAVHYVAQLEAMAGISLADRIAYRSVFTPDDFGQRFDSWRNSMLGPSHVLRQSAFWRTADRSRTLSNLYYVGAGTTPGVGLPMCLISATNVVGRMAREGNA